MVQAIDGRRLGARAQATRRRLLDATAELLESEGILELKVVEVARKVGTSPATFYQYFANVEEAVLALAEEAGAEIDELVPLVDRPWKGTRALPLARAPSRRPSIACTTGPLGLTTVQVTGGQAAPRQRHGPS